MNLLGKTGVYQKNQKRTKGKGKAERESPWFEYGTDADYQAWCRKQPSARSGETKNVIYAHYRLASNSGTGIKPPYSGIPLTVEEHLIQHQIGQFEFLPREEWERLIYIHLCEWKYSFLK